MIHPRQGRGRTTLTSISHAYAAVMLAVTCMLSAPAAHAQAEQRTLVSAAALTLTSFLSDPDMAWLRRNFGRAKAVMIAPDVTKASLILGGSTGRAVVVARNPRTGTWAGPAFFRVGTASVGVQAGFAVSEMVSLLMTEKALNKVLSGSLTMGGNVAIAVGPVGAGSQSDFVADIVSFSRSAGVYVGADLNGTVVRAADDWNRLYYGRTVQAVDILERMNASSRHARELLNLVANAANN
jgi:SH3 domain-containing YSC84-like protein 1